MHYDMLVFARTINKLALTVNRCRQTIDVVVINDMLKMQLYGIEMFQFQIVFTIIRGVVAITFDKHCTQFTKLNYTGKLSFILINKL